VSKERGRVWQAWFYDFVVFSDKKRVEKLRYMHGNPVKRGLVLEPEESVWSRYRQYAYREVGPVVPTLRTSRSVGQPIQWRKLAPGAKARTQFERATRP
jgi:hypothetical protein